MRGGAAGRLHVAVRRDRDGDLYGDLRDPAAMGVSDRRGAVQLPAVPEAPLGAPAGGDPGTGEGPSPEAPAETAAR